MENDSLIQLFQRSGVIIEKPGDKTANQKALHVNQFTMEPLAGDAALERGTVLGCIFALLVMATAGLALFAGVHALITGRAF
jgi:hypothetical protein